MHVVAAAYNTLKIILNSTPICSLCSTVSYETYVVGQEESGCVGTNGWSMFVESASLGHSDGLANIVKLKQNIQTCNFHSFNCTRTSDLC